MAATVRIDFQARVPRNSPIGKLEARTLIRRAVRATLDARGITSAEVSVTLLDDEAIAEMNERYLAHEGPTDVISFPLHTEGLPPIGDLYIGWDQMLRQAAAYRVPPKEELARLAIHGTLHVLGLDHPEGVEREQSEMWQLQETILSEVVGK